MGFFISEIRGNNMKAGLKRIISIALTLSLVWGIAGGIAPVKTFATTFTITFDPNGGSCDPTSATTDETGRLTSLPEPSYEGHNFIGWHTATENGSQVYANDTVFDVSTTIYALWSDSSADNDPQPSQPEPEPEIDFENSIVPPSLPPSDNVTSEPEAPSEPEDPYAKKQEEANKQLEDTINKFLSAKDRLASTGSSEEFALFTGSYNSGLTLDMGILTSFKKDTYDKISELVSVGVPVTIKYIHKVENRSLTIPKYCKADLSSYCDETGYIGFENLKGQLIRDKYIEASEEDIAAFTKARDNMQSIFRISQADNAATANSGAGMAPTPINGGFTPFAAFGSSSFRAQSG
ncbi:MAG: InlB B-repeat-containing protein [Lachnospiraceae bacterium]|nr:InlB B-repeat-containing protein [Lachnospiraceae bacterium]